MWRVVSWCRLPSIPNGRGDGNLVSETKLLPLQLPGIVICGASPRKGWITTSGSNNLGSGTLQRSTFRRKVDQEEHAQVPDQLLLVLLSNSLQASAQVARWQLRPIA